MDFCKVDEFKTKLKNLLQDSTIKKDVDMRDIKRIFNVDRYAMCFINWKKGDIDSAVSLATEVFKWRKERNINDIMAEDLSQNLLNRGVVFVHGKAIDDTRLVYFLARHQSKEIKFQVQEILCLWLERLHHQELGKHITFVLDVSKSSMSNVDLAGIKFLLECFTKYFPDMLERIFILEMPWIMNAIWKIVKQWMSEEQRKKTIFCNFKGLSQYVDSENLLTAMGGQDNWQYSFPPDESDMPNIFLLPEYDFSPDMFMSEESESIQDDSFYEEEEEEYVLDDVEITSTVVSSQQEEVVTVNSDSAEPEKAISDLTYTIEPIPSCSVLDNKISNHSYTSNISPSEMSQCEENQDNLESDFTPEQSLLDSESTGRTVTQNSKKEKSLEAIQSSRVSPKSADSSNVKLKSLLLMSPASEVLFQENVKDQRSGRYQSIITLTNPNKDANIAFKVKTNSPNRYHVKPSTGCVFADEVLTIRINLSPGYEEVVSSDRFLILYQVKKDDDDIAEFWKNHLEKEMRFEHRLQVRFHLNPATESENFQSNLCTSSKTSSVVFKNVTPFPDGAIQSPPPPPLTEPQLEKLTMEVAGLKAKLLSSEQEAARFRASYSYSVIIQAVLLMLLLYVVYCLSLLTDLLELGLNLKR